jgi:hypothetical protein
MNEPTAGERIVAGCTHTVRWVPIAARADLSPGACAACIAAALVAERADRKLHEDGIGRLVIENAELKAEVARWRECESDTWRGIAEQAERRAEAAERVVAAQSELIEAYSHFIEHETVVTPQLPLIGACHDDGGCADEAGERIIEAVVALAALDAGAPGASPGVTPVATLRRLIEALDECEGSRGRFSCLGVHDSRCPKSRAASPEHWRGTWQCECGAEELDAALQAARDVVERAGVAAEGRDVEAP